MKFSRRPLLILYTLFAVGCAVLVTSKLDELYGPEKVQNRIVETPKQPPEYFRDVKEIVDARCVVCHSCLDAPCQLKMSSFEAIDRGANKLKVYNGTRLLTAEPTRMFEDAHSTEAWRDKGFFPVLNERVQIPEANLRASTMYRALLQKKNHPLPDVAVLPESFDFRLNRDQQCPTADEFDQHEKDYPLWGMPYGLPALEEQEFNTLKSWLENGAKSVAREPLSAEFLEEIKKWETWINRDDLKTQLVARYIYEHLYLGNLYFSDVKEIKSSEPRLFFKLVRSATKPGEPVENISTRRPFDDPKVSRVYYRFVPYKSTVTEKTHMPYKLDKARLKRWDELFFENNFEVTYLPDYKSEDAANPFVTFEQIPARSRYKFMLDEARYTISGFIKGPVCRGQTALNVINDHFWVMFVNPEHHLMDVSDKYLSKNKNYLRLPAGSEDNKLGVLNWVKYSKLQHEYEKNRLELINQQFPTNKDITLDVIWAGDGNNKNAALTIFRHYDSATVIKGHVGDVPKTVWVIPYALLERIHYLLVSGFDVYGTVSHQLMTRLYMDFLRMEGEVNFLLLLPKETQKEKLAYWNRDAQKDVKEYLQLVSERDAGATGIEYKTADHQKEVLELIHQKFGKNIISVDDINRPIKLAEKDSVLFYLQQLAETRGESLSFINELSVMRLEKKDGSFAVYTLVRNLAHSNVSHLFGEEDRLLPSENSLTILPGVVGAHPNAFFQVKENQLPEFVKLFKQLENEETYSQLLNYFGLRRTSSEFWAFSDWLHDYYKNQNPVEYGVLDYNRLENR